MALTLPIPAQREAQFYMAFADLCEEEFTQAELYKALEGEPKLSRRTFFRYLKEYREAGALKIVRKEAPGPKGGRPGARYRVNLPKLLKTFYVRMEAEIGTSQRFIAALAQKGAMSGELALGSHLPVPAGGTFYFSPEGLHHGGLARLHRILPTKARKEIFSRLDWLEMVVIVRVMPRGL